MQDTLRAITDTVTQLSNSPFHLDINDAIKSASNTQFFQGGILLAVLAWLGTRSKGVFSFLFGRLIRAIKYSTYMDNALDNDRGLGRRGRFSAYDCMCTWLHIHHPDKFKNIQFDFVEKGVDNHVPHTDHLSDTIWFWYKRRFITIISRRETLENASESTSRYIKSYDISGLFAKKQINMILTELQELHAKKIAEHKELQFSGNTIHYNESDYWAEKEILNKKSFDNIFFEGKDELLADLDRFKDSIDDYNKRLKINYKRGYCFEGPPGAGKSATTLAMSSYLNRNIYYFNLSAIRSDSSFISLMRYVQPNSIIVFEDIDTFMKGRLDKDTKDKTNLTFSTLLQTFNGIYEPENAIFIITTNHYEVIDPALIRSGRIDYTITFKNPTLDIVMQFINHFYGTNFKTPAYEYYKETFSMSDIQELCISNSNDIGKIFEILFGGDKYELEENDLNAI